MRPSLSKATALAHSLCSLKASITLVGVTTGGATVAADDGSGAAAVDDDAVVDDVAVAEAGGMDASSLRRLLLLCVMPDEDALRSVLESMAALSLVSLRHWAIEVMQSVCGERVDK